jgi:MoxR-like ATPase
MAQKPVQDVEAIARLAKARQAILSEVHKVIIGQDEIIEHMLIAMFCKGHCLVVGVPGLAKTLMVSTIASVLRLKFSRIQFTPDLMPSDITGTTVIEEDVSTGKRNFRFVKGPVFGNVVLADEINRTPPKTQAALLQAMQEYQVTAGGETYNLALPFFVLATQNPIEQEGTYPLPEAQLDRFMLNLYIDYPSHDEEHEIVKATTYGVTGEATAVLSAEDILSVQQIIRRVPVSDHVIDYAVRLARATRPTTPDAPQFIKQYISWGAGPRAAQALVLGAKARAILAGRYNVTSSDIRALVHPVLRHRIFTNFNADAEGITADGIVEKLLGTVAEPTSAEYT